MLNRKYRATRLDIEDTIKTGTSIFGVCLYAKISKNNLKNPSFAIVVSKKNEKTSVGRHHIKRKITSYIEKNLEKLNPEFKKTTVFFVKNIKEAISYIEVEKDVDFILNKAQK